MGLVDLRSRLGAGSVGVTAGFPTHTHQCSLWYTNIKSRGTRFPGLRLIFCAPFPAPEARILRLVMVASPASRVSASSQPSLLPLLALQMLSHEAQGAGLKPSLFRQRLSYFLSCTCVHWDSLKHISSPFPGEGLRA